MISLKHEDKLLKILNSNLSPYLIGWRVKIPAEIYKMLESFNLLSDADDRVGDHSSGSYNVVDCFLNCAMCREGNNEVTV